jgi:ethanolamine transporter EutH
MVASFTNLSGAPPLAVSYSTAFELGAILGITIAVIVSCAIPLTTGITRGHVALGIIAALITLPIAATFGCCGGLPAGCAFSMLISIIPVSKNKPLLSQAEIEKEMDRARGY